MSLRRLIVRPVIAAVTLSLVLAGCGQPFHVISEPGHAEIYVDGKFSGTGGAVVPTNGIVFNSYDVEARDKDGKVLAKQEVNVSFSARSAVFFTIGLFGILVWPLLPFLPLAFFVGDPSPEHVYLRVPADVPPPPPEPETLDRPLLQVLAPGQAARVAPGETLVVKGRARHWSGVAQVTVQLDGNEVARIAAPSSSEEVELPFEARIARASSGHHVVRVIARALRGSEASEEVRVTFAAAPGEPPPPPPEKVPGLEPVGDGD